MRKTEFAITDEYSGRTVGDILKSKLCISSRLLTLLKRSGGILLDGKSVTVRETVTCGQILSLEIRDELPSENIVPVKMPLDILYEDEDILAVSKPHNMPIHPSAYNYDNTLGNAVMYHFAARPFVYRPITRLDRDTTGVVLIAKNKLSAALLTDLMTEKKITKTYIALLSAIPLPLCGTVEAPIGRCADSVIKREVSQNGKHALTHYKVIGINSDGTCVARLNPVTGRTHQIRVHMAHIGCPLMYDFLYGKEQNGKSFVLHCESLEFPHPVTGEKTVIISKKDI